MAVEYGAEKIMMVSSHKAVNPTNVTGCSEKPSSRIYATGLWAVLSVRERKVIPNLSLPCFGNVLGSNGSANPRFKDAATFQHPKWEENL